MNNTSSCIKGTLCINDVISYIPPPSPQKLYFKSVHINIEFVLILLIVAILIMKLIHLLYIMHFKQVSNSVEVIRV